MKSNRQDILEKLKQLKAYEVVKTETLEELNSLGVLLNHRKTKARILLLINEDRNKVFNIGFRTPPPNDTGVPHIMEHSVLCGSRKFPLKDPFIELAKGSLNTFLNAMTYPEKTLYPIASCNDKDFHNLMDVYLDAVLHPNIYEHPEIFQQEGWSYQMEDPQGDLQINGVVYNEMKGAYSDPEDVLERVIMNTLFPQTSYACDSGGDPQSIPSLTYEEFLDFHRAYYHPSNSYIYLYGDLDMAETLRWMDEEYLSEYDYRQVDSQLRLQPAFQEMKEAVISYPVSEKDDLEKSSFLTYSKVIGDYADTRKYIAFQVLEYALLNSPGAPIKRALQEAGIGQEIYGDYSYGNYQPYFTVTAKNAREDQKQEFLEIIIRELETIIRQGFQKETLLAGINSLEFKYREADFGEFPKGLLFGINMYHTWLFDDENPFGHSRTNAIFEELRQEISQGYFETLCREYLLENPFGAVVVAKPEAGLAAKREEELQNQLAEKKAALSQEDRERLAEATRMLRAYQEKPESSKDLEKIPLLDLEDISSQVEPLNNTQKELDGIPILHHDFFTNGIGYLNLSFDGDGISGELLPYVGLYRVVFGMMDTQNYTYQELANYCSIFVGGLNLNTGIYNRYQEPDQFHLKVEIRAKVKYENVRYPFEIIDEILHRTKYEDLKHLHDLISETRSRLSDSLVSAGNSTAALRAMSYYSRGARIHECLKGMDFYRFLEMLDDRFDQMAEEIVENLQKVGRMLFSRSNLLVSFASDEQGYEQMIPCLKQFVSGLQEQPKQEPVLLALQDLSTQKKNEGICTASQVQYVAVAGDYRKSGYEYSGAMKVLRVLLSYDYLWNQIRVKGGAYGCGFNATRNGDCYISSYRDPNLDQTLEAYEGIPKYLEEFQADDRTMRKYIIGAISDMDTPLTYSARGGRSYSAYVSNLSMETLNKERQEVLSTTVEKIRDLSGMLRGVLQQKDLCVIGGESRIKDSKEQFLEVVDF